MKQKRGKTYIIKNIPQSVKVPTGLTAERLDEQSVELTWDEAEADGICFNVYRKVGNGDIQLIASNVKPTLTRM